MEITSEVLEVAIENIKGADTEHAVFKLTSKPLPPPEDNNTNNKKKKKATKDSKADDEKALVKRKTESSVNVEYPTTTVVNGKLFCDLFPFHIIFDKDLIIKQCGTGIQKLAGQFCVFHIRKKFF